MSKDWNFSCIMKCQCENSVSPARLNSYPPTHTSSVHSLQLRTSCVQLKKAFLQCWQLRPPSTPTETIWHIPASPVQISQSKRRGPRGNHTSDRDILIWMVSCQNETSNSLKPVWFQEKNVQAAVCRCVPGSITALSVGGQTASPLFNSTKAFLI